MWIILYVLSSTTITGLPSSRRSDPTPGIAGGFGWCVWFYMNLSPSPQNAQSFTVYGVNKEGVRHEFTSTSKIDLRFIDPYLQCTLNGIGLYAKEHNLSPEEVRSIFDAGLAAGATLGYITIS